MKKRGLLSILVGMAILSFTLFNSCEIGLGESVDTAAPSIKIESPKTSAVVRDAFAIKGSWSDDGSISRIEVKLASTGNSDDDAGKMSYTFNGQLDGGDKWSCVIDPKAHNIKDGKYEATIHIFDNGGHSTEISRAFVIDNTAPVVVLQRPATKPDEGDFDHYGQTFSLTGQAADDNDIKLCVKIYSDPECNNLIDKIDIPNVPPTISQDVAKFELNKDNFYSKIYGSTKKNGEKQLYCSIVAYDGAKRYPATGNEKENDNEGNSTEFYYLYNDLVEILADYKVTDLYKIMNKTFEDSDTSRAINSNTIQNLLIEYKTSKGSFSLNPANNPEFKVVGREGLATDGSAFSNPANNLANGEQISLKVDVGLDAIGLKKDSLKPYILPCDANAVSTVENKVENRIYPKLGDKPAEVSGTGYTFTFKVNSDTCFDKDGKPVDLTVGNNYIIAMEGEDVKGNEVVAEDSKVFGFRLAPSGAAPIVDIVTIVNPVEGNTAAQENSDSTVYVPRYKPGVTPQTESVVRFIGNITVEDGTPTVEMTIGKGTAQTISVTETAEKGVFTFTKDIPVSSLENPSKAGQHNVVFSVSQSQTTRVTRSIMYQPDAPKVTITRVEPTAYKYPTEENIVEKVTIDGNQVDKKYLNGKNVKLNVTIIAGSVGLNEKDDDKKPKIEFIQAGEVKKSIPSPTLGETPFIDTTEFAEGELLIRITAYDMAGNKTVTEEKFYVSQDTDKPVILPNNSGNTTLIEDTSKELVEDLGNTSKNIYSANQTVSFKLIDDDGLKSASYTIRKPLSTDPNVIKSGAINTLNGTKDYQYELTMPDTPGTYYVTINTTDVNSTELNSAAYTGIEPKSNSLNFYVRVTASAPVIEEVALESTKIKGTDSITPIVKIKSDQVPFRLLRIVKNKTTGDIVSAFSKVYTSDGNAITLREDDTNGRKEFEDYGFNVNSPIPTIAISKLGEESPDIDDDTIELNNITASGNYVVYYKVIDKNTKSGEGKKEITVDLHAPKITSVKLAGSDYNAAKWYNSKTIALSVNAEDIAGETGIESPEYSTNGTVWTALSYDKTSQAYTGSAVFDTEGSTNALHIRVKDKAGNETYYDGTTENGTQDSSSIINVKIDPSAPVLTVDKYQISGLEEKDIDTSKIYVKNGVTLTLKGTCADKQSDIAALNGTNSPLSFAFVDSEGEVVEAITPTIKNAVKANDDTKLWNWTAEYSITNASALGNLKVAVKNGADVTSSVTPFAIIRDSVPPELKNISLSINTSNTEVYKKSETEYFVNNSASNPKFTVSGISTDDKGVDKVILDIYKKNDSNELVLIESKNTDKSDFSFADLNWNTSEYSGLTQITLKLTATDIAGNTTPDTSTTYPKSTSKTFTVSFDTTAPVSEHVKDAKGKDLYFRIGDNENDDITKTSTTPRWDNDLDTDVGGKYADGTYGDANTIKIRGSIKDEAGGSGIKRIYYKVFQIPAALPEGTSAENYITTTRTSFTSNFDTEKTGYISNFGNEETRRVFYTGKEVKDTEGQVTGYDGTVGGVISPAGIRLGTTEKFYKEIKTNYKETLSGFKEGDNYVLILAEDNVGNILFESQTFKLNVDTVAPVITPNAENDFDKNHIVNGEGKDSNGAALVISGKVQDGKAGIKSFIIKVNENAIGAENIKYDGNEDKLTQDALLHTWSATIPASVINSEALKGAISVYAEATDNAGKGHTVNRKIGAIQLDNTPPSIRVTSTAGWIKDKIENASVYVTDTNGLKKNGTGENAKQIVSYNVYASTDFESTGELKSTATSLANGTVEVDTKSEAKIASIATTNTTKFKDGDSYIVRFTAEDIVGNKAYVNTEPYTIDRTAPTLSDDDSGVGIGNVEVKTRLAVGNENRYFNAETLKVFGKFTDKAGSVDGSGVTTINYKLIPAGNNATPISGSWQTTDGNYSSNLAGFTNGSNSLELTAVDAKGNKSSTTTYTVKVDTVSPFISEDISGDFTKITLTNGTGTRSFKFKVTDSSSGFDTTVDNISVNAGSRPITNGSNGSTIVVSENTVTITIGAGDLEAIATESGTYSVTAKVKDNAGNESNSERIGVLKIDSDKPVPSFTSHQASAKVNKIITLAGKVTDPSNSAIQAISLTATSGTGNSAVTKTYGYPTGTNGNITYANGQWSLTLDTTEFNNTTTAQNLVLSLSATDEAGNISDSNPTTEDVYEPVTLTLSIDQNSDRPEVKLTSVRFNADGSRFGYVNSEITGNLSDDDGIPTEMAYRLGTSGGFIDSEDTNSKLTYSNVDGSFSITLDDDSYDLYFRIKDAAGGEFVSKVNPEDADLLTMPILKDKIGTIFGAKTSIKDTIVKMTIDTNTPDVETPEFTIDNGKTWQIGLGSQNFGGTLEGKNKKIFKIRQNAYDRNQVKKMTVKVIEVVDGEDSDTLKFNETYDTLAASNPYVPVSIKKGTKTYLQFTSNDIDVAGWKSTGKDSDGKTYSYRLEITMSDGIKETVTKLDLSIDNTAPKISFSGPVADSVNSGEITVYGTTDELGEIYFTVSTDGINKPSSNTKLTSWSGYSVDDNGNRTAKTGTIAEKDVPVYVQIPNAGVSWYVYFDGNTTDTQRAHGVQLKNYASILGLTTDVGNFKDLVNFYIWIKVVDSVGNWAEYPYLVCVDPQGDRPSATLSNPEKPGESVGGTVKLYGTAEDSNGTVESVWVQLVSAKNGTGYGSIVKDTDNKITSFTLTTKDLDFWKTNGYTVEKIKPDANGNHTAWNGTIATPGALTGADKVSDYGIKANFSGTSWNLKINSNSEFNPASGSKEANDMAVRIYAVDDEKNLSYAVTRYFKMDNDTPVISDVMLKQYADNDTTFANSISSQEARIGMYVKGKWYLEFKADDNESLDNIVLTDPDGQDSTLAEKLSDTKSKTIRYELPTATGVGSFKRTIKATDKNNHTGTYEIEINYDNEAPKLLIDTATEFGIDPNVKQSNGFYRLSSKVSDASLTGTPSGVKAVGFYFMRRKTKDEGLIYDPMQKRATPLSTKNLTYADGLYWMSGAIECKEDGSIELKTDLSEKAAYIHTGSYIRLDGVMYKITNFDGTNKVTIAESHASYGTAQIALALFVDNQKSEYEATTTKNESGYYTSIKNDDGDGMVEELGGTSALATWSCSIVSSNIPDGPIEIHYTAYDAALNYAVGIVGNKDKTTYLTYSTAEKAAISGEPTTDGQYSSYVYSYIVDENQIADPAFVSNNAPRLAGVEVATDTNGNGQIDAGEWVRSWNSSVFEYSNWDKAQKTLSVPDTSTKAAPVSIFTTKGLTNIKPEIIGGNGLLKYNYTVSKRNDGGTDWATPYYTKSALTQLADQTADAQYQAKATVTPIEFTVKDYLTAGTTGTEIIDADNQKFTFTIWDSTDGTICGTDSQKATLDVIMSVKLRDSTAPQAKINPFFWTSLNKNSIYGSDAKDSDDKFIVKTVNDLAGHVELENPKNTKPDLSGKVVLRGTATDTKMVKKLYISIPEMATKFDSVTGMTPKTVKDVSVNPEVSTDYYLAATYNSTTGAWTTYGNLATNGFAMKITKSEFSATGHSVEWEFDWDTSAISTTAPAKEGIVVKILAEDEGIPSLSNDNVSYAPNTSAEGTAQTTSTTSTAKYTVDVVPYITEITRGTTISGGAMNRSKLGSYPVSEGETLTVTGFNLKGGKWAVGRTTNQTLADFAQNATTGKDSFTMTVPAYSGNLSVTVASVVSVNNSNRTDLAGNEEIFTMKGSSVKYTAEDNRYLAVWTLGNFFKNTDGGAELQKPVMTADKSGNLYASWAAQSNSNIMFSYGVNQNTTAIFRCFDQPAIYTGISFNTKGTNGGANIAFIPEQQGSGGTFAVHGLSSSQNVGGMGAIQVLAADITAKTSKSGLKVQMNGNPAFDRMDSGGNATNYWNIANYDMTRRLGSYTNPRSAKYNSYLHNIWYDEVTESIRYSVVNATDANISKFANNAGGIVGWVVIDGGYTGQDRLHNFTAANNNTGSINNKLLSYGYIHTGVTKTDVDEKDRTFGNSAIYDSNIFFRASNITQQTGANDKTSITFSANNSGLTPAVGDTIALMENTAGKYYISLRKITDVTSDTINWSNTVPVTHQINTATVYKGNINAVGGSVDNLDASAKYKGSSGSSADIDVDTSGYPVIAYLDDNSSTLRIAKANSQEPKLASNWTRTTTEFSCSGSVSMRIDSNDHIHIMYKNEDGQLCYLFGTPSGNTYNFNAPEIIDETGSMDYGSLSVIESGTGTTKTCIPCVSYLNSAGTAQAVKYAVRSSAPSYSAASTASDTLSEDWDFMILPSLGNGHYAVKENQVSLEARKTGWIGKDDTLRNGGAQTTATPATVQAAIAFKSTQFETAYLKTE